MRIVIDLQGAQSASRFRGIGRYSLDFTKAVARQRGPHEVIVVLSDLFPQTIEPICTTFADILPKGNICVWSAPGPLHEDVSGNQARREVAALIRDAFIADLQPDVLHISSVFEGYVDDAFTDVPDFGEHPAVSISLYDLIPLLNPEEYFAFNPLYERFYLRKLEQIKRATLFLAISEFSREEGLAHITDSRARFVNVAAGHDARFKLCELSAEAANTLTAKWGITKPFVLYTGGTDERKNLPRLIQAFAKLPSHLRAGHQLVLAGNIAPGEMVSLNRQVIRSALKSDEICFTGYVSDDDIVALYNLCSLFVFPSWHEGFGLPALEAMACGAPVIGANTSSLPEVIGLPEALFDPFDVSAIAQKMTQALVDDAFRARLREHGLRQASLFSWDETAKRALRAWEALPSKGSVDKNAWRHISKRLADTHRRLIEDIASAAAKSQLISDHELLQIAVRMDRNERQLNRFLRATPLPVQITWRLEGPFDSTYSLALVNREIARALATLGHRVVLHSTEGPGDFVPSEKCLFENADLAAMYHLSSEVAHIDADVVSRNLYPPRVEDMTARFNLLHAYAWEETGMPAEWIEEFNSALHGMTVVSTHVNKVMVDNGVTVPIAVCGNGVDHWLRIVPEKRFRLQAKSFRFLHVSSCFPRKGADVMVQAYGKTFRASDDVTLVIKTFPNPHNEIHRWLEEAKANDPDFPDVVIFEADYTDAQLKALYEQCHALVAPSRAEGFGLPMAEAMLSGLAVITTGWSGQTDFCTPDTAWLIDYTFSQAKTHFGLSASVWAEPDEKHLGHLMREVYETPEDARYIRIAAGQRLLEEKFRWSDAAQRLVAAARNWTQGREAEEPRIGWVTTWNVRCGIATYSEHLIHNMPAKVTVLAAHNGSRLTEDGENVQRCWTTDGHDALIDLSRSIDEHGLDTLVIQFNYGFFDLQRFADFLNKQLDRGRTVVVTMHATIDPAHAPHKKLKIIEAALRRSHRVFVHTPDDLNRLKKLGLINNVTLFPHGLIDFPPSPKASANANGEFVVASYGFFLPHKGLLELIEAIALLRNQGMRVRLNMVNAEYPVPESKRLVAQARARISSLNLDSAVYICTDYLSDRESLDRLAKADLIVFPYQDTGESSSAAVRYGIATGRPVAVAPIPVFNDVEPAVHALPGQTVEDIVSGLTTLIRNISSADDLISEKERSAEKWRAEHRYSRIGLRLYGILVALKSINPPLLNSERAPIIDRTQSGNLMRSGG